MTTCVSGRHYAVKVVTSQRSSLRCCVTTRKSSARSVYTRHTHTHTHTTHTRTHTHTHAHIHIHTQNTHSHTCRAYTHLYTQSRTHHTHIHTRAHPHACRACTHRVRVDVRLMVRVSKLLRSDYGQGKFRVIVTVIVRLGLGLQFDPNHLHIQLL